jgi:hypothetical protein
MHHVMTHWLWCCSFQFVSHIKRQIIFPMICQIIEYCTGFRILKKTSFKVIVLDSTRVNQETSWLAKQGQEIEAPVDHWSFT